MLQHPAKLSGSYLNLSLDCLKALFCRAVNGAGCQVVTPIAENDNMCEFMWLMDCDYKGWMPQSVLDIAMPVAQTQFIDSVRKLAEKLKEEGKF